jgi:hypothetical protein
VNFVNEWLQAGELDTSEGISLLEAKSQLMLSYNVALGIYMSVSHGLSLATRPASGRLVFLAFASLPVLFCTHAHFPALHPRRPFRAT